MMMMMIVVVAIRTADKTKQTNTQITDCGGSLTLHNLQAALAQLKRWPEISSSEWTESGPQLCNADMSITLHPQRLPKNT